MRKTTKRILVACLAACVIPSLTSCLGRDDGEKIDEAKSQLYIGVWDGGYGISWAEKWGDDFEELYKDHSFESGKTGVQVHVTPSKSYAQAGAATGLKNKRTKSSLLNKQTIMILLEMMIY